VSLQVCGLVFLKARTTPMWPMPESLVEVMASWENVQFGVPGVVVVPDTVVVVAGALLVVAPLVVVTVVDDTAVVVDGDDEEVDLLHAASVKLRTAMMTSPIRRLFMRRRPSVRSFVCREVCTARRRAAVILG
jgi:hypothetical protein